VIRWLIVVSYAGFLCVCFFSVLFCFSFLLYSLVPSIAVPPVCSGLVLTSVTSALIPAHRHRFGRTSSSTRKTRRSIAKPILCTFSTYVNAIITALVTALHCAAPIMSAHVRVEPDIFRILSLLMCRVLRRVVCVPRAG
jgi:hypothetical protein